MYICTYRADSGSKRVEIKIHKIFFFAVSFTFKINKVP